MVVIHALMLSGLGAFWQFMLMILKPQSSVQGILKEFVQVKH
jgi:hypothetical protein